MSTAIPHSTTDREALDRQLVALVDDLKAAEHASDRLDDSDLSFDVGILLHRAREAVQEAAALLDRLPPPSRYDYEPRSCGAVVAY
jgi:hypothetical protein